MIRAKSCIICGHDNPRSYPAALAPFIKEYVFGGEDVAANMIYCPRCQMMFSDVRFDDAETLSLYKDYRGERYAAIRDKLEPGYRSKNEQLGHGDAEMSSRRYFIDLNFKTAGITNAHSVLDYGGDQGQFIPAAFASAKRYVYDLSGVPTLPGVESNSTPGQHAPHDVIICAEVMEHVADPIHLMKELVSLLKPDGSIYIEVPAGIPTRRYFNATLNPDQLGENGKIRFHEHINYFTTCSLQNAMRLAGLEPKLVRMRRVDLGWGAPPIIGCIAGKASAGSAIKMKGRAQLFFEGIRYAFIRNIAPPLQGAH